MYYLKLMMKTKIMMVAVVLALVFCSGCGQEKKLEEKKGDSSGIEKLEVSSDALKEFETEAEADVDPTADKDESANGKEDTSGSEEIKASNEVQKKVSESTPQSSISKVEAPVTAKSSNSNVSQSAKGDENIPSEISSGQQSATSGNTTQTPSADTASKYIGVSAEELAGELGQPGSSTYASSCIGEGEDGELYYDGFTVYTYRDENGVEIVQDVMEN